MIELTKISTERAHRLFNLLRKLELLDIKIKLDSADKIHNAWKYAKKHELQKKYTRDT